MVRKFEEVEDCSTCKERSSLRYSRVALEAKVENTSLVRQNNVHGISVVKNRFYTTKRGQTPNLYFS